MSDNDKNSRCPNGHIIPFGSDFCPWCGETAGNNSVDMPAAGNDDPARTSNMEQTGSTGSMGIHTVMLDESPLAQDRTVIMRPQDSKRNISRIVGFLMTYDTAQAGTYYPLHEGRQTVGRGSGATITINDSQLSQEHAVILYRNSKFLFEDSLSTNGSVLNGKEAVGQLELHHGDILEMGNAKYVIVEIPQNA